MLAGEDDGLVSPELHWRDCRRCSHRRRGRRARLTKRNATGRKMHPGLRACIIRHPSFHPNQGI